MTEVVIYRGAAILLGLLFLSVPTEAQAFTAEQILDLMSERHVGKTFRGEILVDTYRGTSKLPRKILWIMGKIEREHSTFFLEFEKPDDARGMRFLFKLKPRSKPEVFMHVPSLGKTVRVKTEDPTADIGGTGISINDLLAFTRQPGQKEALVGEDKVDGRVCYVIRVSLPDKGGQREIWVSKDDLQVVKSRETGPDGKVRRTYRVVRFFKTLNGQVLPREQEIVRLDEGTRMKVKQEHGFTGIPIPEEILKPDSFGTYRWRL